MNLRSIVSAAALFVAAIIFALTIGCAATRVALADETSKTENFLLAEGLADTYLTQRFLHGGPYDCRAVGYQQGICHVHEGDPLAVPFIRSASANFGAALVVNGSLRLLPVIFPKARLTLGRIELAAAILYLPILVKNGRVVTAQVKFKTGAK